MVHNYFTGGTYQFLMIAEHMLTLPTSALITLHCVLKKRCLEIFGSLCKQCSRFVARGLDPVYIRRSARAVRQRPSPPARCRGRRRGAEPGGPGAPDVEATPAGLRAVPGEGGVRRRGAGGGSVPQHMLLTFASGVMQLGNSITGRRWGWGSPGSLFPGRWRRGLAGGI